MNSYERTQILLNFANRTDNDSMTDIMYSTTEANSKFDIKRLADIKLTDNQIDDTYGPLEINVIVTMNKMAMLKTHSFESILKYKLSRKHLP